ncbi:bacillithiol biosynthesis deacetylase BshB2 [Priestia taiwanensis]|uniref:N-acetyl-alpha-D-glucosaminyl L-malate deacetylase 2 n=1 Tax=Priestia taiwanensis TaxID=1347902 RepID=A0A917EMC4_9BACI|nr:bacillithiol biosynthesis deacetylase BshB2 [Priestia taiwanensis]MBM7362281.1 bacillithiol biosynthesis deacetylase BshB2 [Priestia taiwanensis]GGE60952.1 putative N-acetyl-alpha-D-glucosaminyl L-malate deacetylase 2 [Priestia taiwanensis]
MKEHILVVFPHPDDESFGAAGTIMLATQKGVPVTYACATLGEMGRNMGKGLLANRETIPALRKKELEDACNVLGIEDLRLLGFRDKTLEFEDTEFVADKIEEVIQDTNPTSIITFYPGEAVHPDHDACGEAVIAAVSRMPKEERPTVYCIAITRNKYDVLGKPDVVHDVTEVVEQKIKALQAHASQTGGLLKDIEASLEKESGNLMKWLSNESFYIYKWND